jgi:hypothetical protein
MSLYTPMLLLHDHVTSTISRSVSSVESERVITSAGTLCTKQHHAIKLHTKMTDETIVELVFMRSFLKNIRRKLHMN